MFCCTLLYVHSSITIILMWKRELFALLGLSSWCLLVVEWLFFAVSQGCLQFMIVVFHDHTHLLFLACPKKVYRNLSKINLNSVPLFPPPFRKSYVDTCFKDCEQKHAFECSFGATLFVPHFFVISTTLTNNETRSIILFPTENTLFKDFTSPQCLEYIIPYLKLG